MIFISKLGLIIEIDGAGHDFDGDYDERRKKDLISLGLKVYRITVVDVLKNMDFVMIGLENYMVEHYGEKWFMNTLVSDHSSKRGKMIKGITKVKRYL